MVEQKKCSKCGAELPPDAPGGHCPQCLLNFAVAPDNETAKPAATIRITPPAEVSPTEKPGDRIRHYKLLQQIGEGGMGTVWMAEQSEPVRRKVALKVVKLGMDTKQVVARFEAERQALALMDHPNIAKVFDAGATDTGRPYFVMELVRGVRITDYCDQQKLSTRQRLDLFVQVCQAIQHAHQKGIIHRDIKPSNVLVTEQDGAPVPKIIDFGIAKATTGQRLTDKTLFTAFEQFIGTPAYMSPEQAGLGGLDIDTRSDIYSLGVLLYELLTGRQPFDAEQIRRAAFEEVLRILRDQEPPRPSARLTTLTEAELTQVAARHQTSANKLSGQLRGDLDWIVMKALEKDRRRRYETANGFAADIQRHLGNEPIIARPPSMIYRFQRLVARNKLVFIGIGAIAITLAIGLVVSLWALKKEQQARQDAQTAQRDAETNRKKAEAEALNSRRNRYAADLFATQYAMSDNNLERVHDYLNEYLPSAGKNDLRGFEWRYWKASSQGSQIKTLNGHSGAVYSLAWSPNGKFIASGSSDRTVRLWDAETGEFITKLGYYRGAVMSVAFSPDSKLLATGAEAENLYVWDIASRSIIFTNRGWAGRAQFSPKGDVLAVGSGGNYYGQYIGDVDLVDMISRQLIRHLPKAGDRFVFSPDGSQMAAANGEHGLTIWDLITFRELKAIPQSRIMGLAFSHNGRLLAFGTWDGALGLYDVEQDKVTILCEPTGGNNVTGVAFSPDENLLVVSRQWHEIQIWDLVKRAQTGRLLGHAGEVTCLNFSPDGKTLASGASDSTVMYWHPGDVLKVELNLWFPVFSWCLLGYAAVSPDHRMVAIPDDHDNVQLLDNSSLQSEMVLTNAGLPVSFNSSGSHLLTCDGAITQLKGWDVASGRLLSSVSTHIGETNWYTGTVSKDQSKIVLGWIDGHIRIVDTKTGECIGTINSGLRTIGIELSPDGKTLALGGRNNVVELWDVPTQSKIHQLVGHRNAVSALAFSPDGKKLYTGSWDSTIKAWDVSTGQLLATMNGHKAGVMGCAVSPEGRTLASSGDDHTLKFWNLTTFREVASFPLGATGSLLKFSDDGATLIVGAREKLKVWRGVSLSEAEGNQPVVE